MGNSVEVGETGTRVYNDTDVATSDVFDALQRTEPEMAARVRWASDAQGLGGSTNSTYTQRHGSILDRDRYVTPHRIYDQIRTAQAAAEQDDITSGVLDTTESLAFSSMSFYCGDEDQEDVWNQWAGDIDLDSRMREMWRELFTCSQVTVAVWWGQKTYHVRGRTENGNKKRKTFADLNVPVGMTILDPLKVAPVGNSIFGQESLVYIASKTETDEFDRVIGDRRGLDPVVEKLIVARYEPTLSERKQLMEDGVEDVNNLYLLNPANVSRHCATRAQYRRHAEVRLRSIFELLDLKHQLKQMDRTHRAVRTSSSSSRRARRSAGAA